MFIAGPVVPPQPVRWSFQDYIASPPCAPDSLHNLSPHSPGNSLTAQDRLQASFEEPVPSAAAAHCPAHHLCLLPDPILGASALQQTTTMFTGSAGPDAACSALQLPFCKTALQLPTADNSSGNAAHPGAGAMATAQLQKADPAALQRVASQLQSPHSVPQLPSSDNTAQLQYSSSAAQLQLSGGKAQVQQKLYTAAVQVSAVAEREPLQRHGTEHSAEPVLTQQADGGGPTYRPAADEGDPTCRPAAEEHAHRYTNGSSGLACTAAAST